METDLIPYSACLCLPARSVLVLAPHPDDEVFGCGGAIAQHVRSGHPVCVVILTDGALYAEADVRQRESVAAAQLLGYGTPEFWNLPDGSLRYSDELAQRLADRIAQCGADLVYAPSPWEIHPDHRQTQMLAVEAVRRSAVNVQLAFYEVGVPLRPNALLDITSLLETKEAAMSCFASQLVHQSYADHILGLNRFRTYTLPKEVLAAEAFWLLSGKELDPSGWTDLLNSVSLGLRSTKPRLGASSASGGLDTRADLTVPMGPVSDQISSPPRQEGGTASVSVLIRTIDRPSLATAIASVVAQSFTDWEIILVNASGHPLTTLPSAEADRVTLTLDQGRPLGRSAAANALLDAARGTYAVFLDDDDRLLPDHLYKLVSALEADLPLIAAYCDVRATLVPGNDDLDAQIHVYQRDFDRSLLQFQNYLPIHSMMFRMESARRPTTSRFDEGLALFEDWDFWLQLAAKGDFKRVSGVSALYALDASTGSGHAVANGALRDSMLQRLGARQLSRWDAQDVAQLIAWQSQRTQELEHAEQATNSNALQLEQSKATIAELNQSVHAHQVEVGKLGELRLGHLKQLEQAQSAIAELSRSVLAQQAEIDTLGRLRLHHLQQLAQGQSAIADLNRSVLALQTEIDTLGRLRLHHLQQLEQAQTSIAELELQRLQDLQQLEQLRNNIVDLKRAAFELEHRLTISNANEFAQQLEIEKLGRLRLEHLKQLDAFNAQLLQIYRSKSWRLTRPLRMTRRLVDWLTSPAPLHLSRNAWRA
ncbi:MAG: PIG-L family deacetylase, partial [Comamonadaceae bacterium]